MSVSFCHLDAFCARLQLQQDGGLVETEKDYSIQRCLHQWAAIKVKRSVRPRSGSCCSNLDWLSGVPYWNREIVSDCIDSDNGLGGTVLYTLAEKATRL